MNTQRIVNTIKTTTVRQNSEMNELPYNWHKLGFMLEYEQLHPFSYNKV